jgi:CDP-diacylglycerol--serine O-phosphatidyltransferase
MSFPLVLAYPEFAPEFVLNNLDSIYDEITLSVVVFTMSLMMVIPVPLFSLKFKTFGFKENMIRYIFLLISIGLIVIFGSFSIALIVFLYLLISLAENATTKNTLE